MQPKRTKELPTAPVYAYAIAYVNAPSGGNEILHAVAHAVAFALANALEREKKEIPNAHARAIAVDSVTASAYAPQGVTTETET